MPDRPGPGVLGHVETIHEILDELKEAIARIEGKIDKLPQPRNQSDDDA